MGTTEQGGSFFSVNRTTLKWLIFIFVIALLVRIPGITWGFGAFGEQRIYNQVDELVQIRIAKESLAHWGFDIKDYQECHAYSCMQWYVRFYADQAAILSIPILGLQALIPRIGAIPFNGLLYIPGRLLSVLYGAATCLLVFFIVRYLTKRDWAGLVGAALFAFVNLDVINSMVMKPHTIMNFFWFLGICLMFIYWKRMDFRAAALILSVATLTFSSKFGIEPFFWVLPILYLAYKQKKLSWKWLLLPVLLFVVFEAANGFEYTPARFNFALDQLGIHKNIDPNTGLKLPAGSPGTTPLGGIPSFNHWLNPIMYIIALIPGVGIPMFILGIVGTILILRNKEHRWQYALIVLVPFALLIGRLSLGTATFERFVHPITPVFAIGTAYFFYALWQRASTPAFSRGVKILLAIVLVYSFGLVAFTEYYYVHDTRLEAGDWIQQHVPTSVGITAPGTTSVIAIPSGYHVLATIHAYSLQPVLALQESVYNRYTKSFTTPFKVPHCCDEVYNCLMEQCQIIQPLFYGKTDYALAAIFTYDHPYPEMRLFKNYFGSYESFIGDYRIYVKQGTQLA